MRPQKMRKATPTQNSALASMGFSRSGVDVVEGGLDALRSRSPAGQALDHGAAVLDDAGEARQDQPGHQGVEHHEGDREPEELAAEGFRLEGRKADILMSAAGRFRCGMGRLSLSHGADPQRMNM